MSYKVPGGKTAELFAALSQKFDIYGPVLFKDQGRYSQTDIIKYDKLKSFDEIVYEKKSTYPMKEVLSPIQQALFYFTEDEFRESGCKDKPILVFGRACDINAMKVQSRIYAGNGGFVDSYYQRMKDRVKYVLMPCDGKDDTCFCVSMNSNVTDDHSLAVAFGKDGSLTFEVKDGAFDTYFDGYDKCDYTHKFVTENITKVTIPEIEDRDTLNALKAHPVWKQFNGRCISCGACTIACSTCTCFTTRDIIYGDNPEVGERRRVASSCQVHGFSDMAGGASYRNTAGDRMRYKMLHKFHDYNARFGEGHMCVGCGRCTSRCPEFISVTATLGKIAEAVKEINDNKGGKSND